MNWKTQKQGQLIVSNVALQSCFWCKEGKLQALLNFYLAFNVETKKVNWNEHDCSWTNHWKNSQIQTAQQLKEDSEELGINEVFLLVILFQKTCTTFKIKEYVDAVKPSPDCHWMFIVQLLLHVIAELLYGLRINGTVLKHTHTHTRFAVNINIMLMKQVFVLVHPVWKCACLQISKKAD